MTITPLQHPQAFPSGEAVVYLPGIVGDIEAITVAPRTLSAPQRTAIICHPHPLQEGTMHNKVVTTLSRTYRDLGMYTVRFNFRGVGASAGTFADAIGETDDLLAVLEWVRQVRPDDNICLAGFSFGSYVAARGMTLSPYPIEHLTCVAPPVHHYAFTELAAITCPWIVVQGEADEVVPPDAVFQWLETINTNPPAVTRMPDVGHFFHRRLVDLREALKTQLQTQLTITQG